MGRGRTDEKSTRNALIYQDRLDGVAAVDIAKKYGVSGPRIHRICLQEENKALRKEVAELRRIIDDNKSEESN